MKIYHNKQDSFQKQMERNEVQIRINIFSIVLACKKEDLYKSCTKGHIVSTMKLSLEIHVFS